MSQVAEAEELTLPMVAIKLRLSLDYVRKHFKRVPELAALCRRIGRMSVVRGTDMPHVRELFAKVKATA